MRRAAAGFSCRNDRVVSPCGARRLSALDVLGRFLDAPVGSRGEVEGVIGAMATVAAQSAFMRIPADHPRPPAHGCRGRGVSAYPKGREGEPPRSSP